jgi:(S)-ureidoglycine aminohydrolase
MAALQSNFIHHHQSQMKKIIVIVAFLFQSVLLFAQAQIQTKVYKWGSGKTPMFEGAGAIFSKQLLKGHAIAGGKKLKFNTGVGGDELFFIIKYGPVHVELNGVHHDLDKGSVVFLLPGDDVVFQNKRKDDVEIYEMQMASTQPDLARGKAAGPSFVMDWFDMNFKPHDRGGVRQLFDRKIVMSPRFDIHITTLNPGLSSHPPHTHKTEEIILMIDGEGEMVLGTTKQKIITGDAAWVESNIPHNITNIAKRPAVYFAIQWN